MIFLLAQRAVADSPRWTHAVEDQSAPIPEEPMSGAWNGEGSGQVPFLLAEPPTMKGME